MGLQTQAGSFCRSGYWGEERESQPTQTAEAITTMLEHDGPYLIELVLERDVPRRRRNGSHCAQVGFEGLESSI